MDYSFGFTLINVLLIVGLMYVYTKNALKVKSLFTLGLFIFAGLFLIQNLVSIYFYVTMMPYYVMDVEIYVLIYSILQTLAFVILNVVTWR